MRRTLSTLLLLFWAFWFGGLLFLVFAVTALFSHGIELGAAAAPVVFVRFEKYHLVLAAVCMVLCILLVQTSRRRDWHGIFICLVIGCVTALITSQILVPRINALHVQGMVHTPEFSRLHGLASASYSIEFLVLLIAGLLLPRAIGHSRHDSGRS